ncbi:MAG: signal recognition particle-docking protein FtsY [Neorhizobium sp.]|nr:signal recognition particle-docking protein FtsY [Neorhizobium sp.]
MALSFIKRVFTFGDQPAEEIVKPNDAVASPAVEVAAAAEVAAPVAAVEEAAELQVVPLPLLEAEAAAGSLAVSPETAPSPLAELAPSNIESADESAKSSSSTDNSSPTPSADDAVAAPATEQGAIHLPISAHEAETPDRAVGGASAASQLPAGSVPPLTDAAGTEPKSAPVLPKGFSTSKDEPVAVAVVPVPKLSWFQRLRAGLARTSSQLTGQIAALFTKRKLDDETLEELEDLLIQADLGVETAMRITGALSSERYGKDVTGEDVSRIMAAEITKVLAPVAQPLKLDLEHKPHVILVVGVNGTGKTTTIGKLAAKLSGSGLKVMLAAGDTFRAAAIEQLKIWADRTGSEFIGTKLGADAAGLAYDAYEQARANKSDVLIIDTAGRLQNRTELMAELEKIVRVLGKLDPDAPHTVLQTLDATTGQNALNQVEIFRNVAGVSGLIMTKLDGTARGGILVGIAAKHKLPVYFIGVGEGVDDLEPFEAKDFAEAIAGLTH